MAINPDIRDQAYQFFVEEAPELLHGIEEGVLALKHDRSPANIHNLMRAAHTIKGGAASVGLDPIATLAHRLENILKAFYDDQLVIDADLENQLLQAYDCLRLPLTEQITLGYFDAEHALEIADPIFTQIELRCGDALNQTDSYIPSSTELGIDMISAIFEVDVAQGLEHLAEALAISQQHEITGELRAQADVFAGFAELLNLPQFGAIAATTQQALDLYPDRALEIAHLALADFEQSRQAVLAGDRIGGSGPSQALIALANATAQSITATNDDDDDAIGESELSSELIPDLMTEHIQEIINEENIEALAIPQLEHLFGQSTPRLLDHFNEHLFEVETVNEADTLELFDQPDEDTEIYLEHQFDDADITLEDTDIVNDWDIIDIEYTPSQSTLDRPSNNAGGLVPFQPNPGEVLEVNASVKLPYSTRSSTWKPIHENRVDASPLTIRVDAERLERMNNLVGELTVNYNSLSLQNEQLQGALRELLNRFSQFQAMTGQLQKLSDQMLVAPERYSYGTGTASSSNWMQESTDRVSSRSLPATRYPALPASTSIAFDPLEMDSYGTLHAQLQHILEDMVQLEEAVDDITLFTRQANQVLNQQRPMLTHLRDELMWSRMLPLGEVLNRFPRVLRDLSTLYHKPVNLTLTGAEVLIDKAILEKLYDPLLHLLRNAFDHGIEPPDMRQQRHKSDEGQIEINAYHRGNQTVIEVKDDGQGLNLDRIRSRILELGWRSIDQLALMSSAQLTDFIFEPGFSTASQVSQLSGRGVGLDVVRSQLQAIKGTVTVASSPGNGTTFTLRLPLMLTITKLVICLVRSAAVALSVDSIEEILSPQPDQVKQSGAQRFLYWQEQIIPVYRLADLLEYACPLPDVPSSKLFASAAEPKNWALPMLVFRHDQQVFALEVDRVITEQELVIKPLGTTIAPPSYTYGCTILADGSLVPVIDGVALVSEPPYPTERTTRTGSESSYAYQGYSASSPSAVPRIQASTILVVDDAATIRRTLALSLERAGYRVVQARDGQEAIAHLQQYSVIRLVICDIEMPNMNGFEFLNYRRQDSYLSAVPVAILTSRSNEKHRWLAMQLGATAYFTKPYLEHEFLAALETIIQEHSHQ
jgi:chemotaxis family two-component system sensor histidine kinase/response regulator PixL